MVAEEINAFNVELGCVHLLRDAYLDLLGRQVGESPLDGLFHRSVDAPGNSQFSRPWRAADLKAVQANLTLLIYVGSVYRSRGKWVGRDHVAPPLFRDPHESFLARLVVDVRERCLMVLAGTQFL